MGFLDRLRSPGSKALRDAGPPMWQVIAAVALGGVADVALAIAMRDTLPLWAYVILPFLLTLAVSIADRDGWVVRGAIAFVGMEQRRRAAGRAVPATPAAAERWLTSPPPDATPFERAAALITAARPTEAAAALENVEPSSPADAVRLIRLRASAAAALDQDSELDLGAIRTATADLPPDDQRYHVLSAAWTQAWLDITRRRPWRARFAPIAREFAPYALPVPLRLVLGVQQYAGPVACVLGGAIVVGMRGLL